MVLQVNVCEQAPADPCDSNVDKQVQKMDVWEHGLLFLML